MRAAYALVALLPAGAARAERGLDVDFVRVPAGVEVGDRLATPRTHSGASRLLFLNRDGGHYTPGWPNDSRRNVSSVPAYEVDAQPYTAGDATWEGILICVGDLFAPYDLHVTDVDPGEADHVEIVVGGVDPEDIGIDSSTTYGRAPLDCGVIENAVAFVFASVGDQIETMCHAIAHEAGHCYGLEHSQVCDDVMSYLDCYPKAFQDDTAICGGWEPAPCWCRDDQNSHQYLLGALGAHRMPPSPTVTITSPADGAIVAPGFVVTAEASGPAPIARVRLFVDGEFAEIDGEAPWEMASPGDLAAGPHDVEVRAVDDQDAEGSDFVSVTLLADEGIDATPGDGGAADAGARYVTAGCGCRASGTGTANRGAALSVLALVWIGRSTTPRARRRASIRETKRAARSTSSPPVAASKRTPRP